MDGISPSVNFTVSSTPPAMEYIEEQEEHVLPSMDDKVAELIAQNQKLQEQLLRQNQEASKKITSLVEQNQLLNQAIQDKLVEDVTVKPKRKKKKKQPKPEDPYDWRRYWNEDFGNDQDDEEEEEEVEKPVLKDIEELVEKTLTKKQRQILEQQRKNMELEQQLVERFNREEKDLHPYANQVVALWKRFAMLNPHQDMLSRYEEVVKTARELFLANQPQPKKKKSKQQAVLGIPSGGQSAPSAEVNVKMPNTTESVSMADLEEDQRKARELAEYIKARQEFLKKRSGFFQPTK